MPDTFTELFNLTKPEVGGDGDVWGDILNDNFDAIDAVLRDRGGDLTTGGVADHYTITPAWNGIADLADGVAFRASIHAANTGAVVLDYATTGPIAVKKRVDGLATALVRGDMSTDQMAHFSYSEDDTCWILENPGVQNTWSLHDWVDVASAASADIGATKSVLVHMTAGSILTVVDFGSSAPQAGYMCIVRFDAGITLVHDSVKLILGGSNLITAAGNCGLFKYEGSGNWRLLIGFSSGFGAGNIATAAEIWTGAVVKAVTVDQMQAAMVEQLLVDAATVTVNFGLGINFVLDPISANRTLALTVPAAVVGRSGYIRVKQDATGGRTLNMGDAKIFNINGQNLVLSTDGVAEDMIYYTIISTTKILMTMARDIN